MNSTTLLHATGLQKSFGRTPALRGASLTVGPRERVAVRGRSGSGKSTLLLCLAGVLLPDAGGVTYLGRRYDAMTADERARLRRREMGLVLQHGQLVPELTVLENVALPLLLEKVERSSAALLAHEWLARLGVAELADARPAEISGGQAQRAAIARALVTGPQLVLADEPTGSLDTVGADEVMAVLLEATRSCDAALVVVTHDNRVAARMDREVSVEDGSTEPAGALR
ncbi:ABC transporter ATP-binding protein [Aeromicrobium massiliense]|uniref:ABC transporter ATP-binding protein n=1 Tax=Aeromicrobium massiliense TaxID=1464554 RepID=UPI0002F1810F|nr:ATP-binding cassette domain-containing protein [Aeromicrobium massiliense]